MACDLHMHGAFGVDFMNLGKTHPERKSRFYQLLSDLYQSGVKSFCPTTLTASYSVLLEVAKNLGEVIKEAHRDFESKTLREDKHAYPIGLHLEGPFLSKDAPGAHPPQHLITLTVDRLRQLLETSAKTIKVITFAPEACSPTEVKSLAQFAKKSGIVLSLGHTQCTEKMALDFYRQGGAQSITHLFNAMKFHHRDASIGALMSLGSISTEIIPDLVHVKSTHLEIAVKTASKLRFASDTTPAALSKSVLRQNTLLRSNLKNGCSMGPLTATYREDASYTSDGHLCGGSHTLPCMLEPTLNTLAHSHPGLFSEIVEKLDETLYEHSIATVFPDSAKVPRLLKKHPHKLAWRINWNNSSTSIIEWKLKKSSKKHKK